MSKINDGGPAFPRTGEGLERSSGMDLRDWFAGQALAAIIAGGRYKELTPTLTRKARAAEAYLQAEAMIAVSQKNGAA